MRIISIDVPFGLTIELHTGVPGRLSIGCEAQHPQSNASEAASSSQEQSDEILIDVPPSTPIDTFAGSMAFVELERADSRTSQRTEPVYDDNWEITDWTSYFQEQGIKIRDFAMEPFPPQNKAREIFDPCLALLKYERMVKMRAREVMQLYDIQWLTEEQARSRLSTEDWAALGDFDRRSQQYPWTHLKLEKPTGTHDEVVAALRLHIKRIYPGREYLDDESGISDIELEGHPIGVDRSTTIRKPNTHPQHADIGLPSTVNSSENVDIEMVDARQDGNDIPHVSHGKLKRFHTRDYLSSGAESHTPLRKRHKFSLDDTVSSSVLVLAPFQPHQCLGAHSGVNAGSQNSFSSSAYPTPSHSPSPSTPFPGSSAIASADNVGHIVPPQTSRPRGLHRKRTSNYYS